MLVLRAMLGVRVCSDCPRCCESEFPCMDSFGAVHEPEGGVLGLVEAYAGAIERGHSVTPLVIETFGGFHPDAWRAIRGLARRHGSRLGADELTAPWCAQSYLSIHVMRISVALQLAAAVEIMDTIQTDRRAQARPEA